MSQLPKNSVLLLEGGAFRGCYTSGALDVFMEEDLYFPTVAAVSAGGLNAVNYLSRQPGRSARINLCYRHDPRYVGPLALLRSRGVVGFNYLFDNLAERESFDYDTFNASSQRLFAVATNVNTGKAEFFEKGNCSDFTGRSLHRLHAAVQLAGEGSTAKPLSGRRLLLPHPLDWALEQGFEHIVVIATRQKGFRKPATSQRMVDLYSDFYANHPRFFASLLTMDLRYNDLMDRMDRLEEEGRIFVLRPGRPVDVGRFEGDTKKLLALINEGREDARGRTARPPGVPGGKPLSHHALRAWQDGQNRHFTLL